MCQSTIKQLDRNSANYLPGGCHYELLHKQNLTASEKARLSRFLKVPLTTDMMDRVFSFMDHDMNAQANLKLATASGKTAFRINKTMDWYNNLTPHQQNAACNLMRRLYKRAHSRARRQYTDAREVRSLHLEAKAAKAEQRRRTLLKSMLKYEDVVIILTQDDWQQWLQEMRGKVSDERRRERNHLAKMSEQFNCLRYRCGIRYGLIPRKTHMKVKLPVDDINAAYELLLTNIENGKVNEGCGETSD